MNFGEINNNIKNNKDIKDSIKNLGINMQYNQYKASVYNLLLNYITFYEMIREEESSSYLSECADLHEIMDYVKSIIDNYNGLSSIYEDRDKLINISNTIQEDMKVLSHYADEVEIYEYIINRIEGKYIDNVYKLNEDDNSFAGYLIQSIFDTEDNVVINEKIKLSLSQLPIRMTKGKFYEFIENAFKMHKGNYINDFNNFIELLKDVSIFNDEDVKFNSISSNIEVLRKTDYNTLDANQYKDVTNHKSLIAKEIEVINSVYTMLINIINNLMEISYCDRYDSYIDNEELLVIDDLFRLLKGTSNISYDDQIYIGLEKIEGVLENNYEEIKRYSSVFELAKNKFDKEIKEYGYSITFSNIEKIDYMISSSSYFVNPELIRNKEDESRVDEFTLMKSMKEFITLLDNYLKDKDREYKRATMGRLLYYLPVTFRKPQEIHEYILNSLQQCSNLYEKNAAKEIIRSVMNDFIS